MKRPSRTLHRTQLVAMRRGMRDARSLVEVQGWTREDAHRVASERSQLAYGHTALSDFYLDGFHAWLDDN